MARDVLDPTMTGRLRTSRIKRFGAAVTALVAAALSVGVLAAPAVADPGYCFFLTVRTDISCLDEDQHTTSINDGTLKTRTFWWMLHPSGDRVVQQEVVIEINPFAVGDYTATVQARNAAGTVLSTETVWYDATSKKFGLSNTDNDVVSLRMFLRDNNTGETSPARVSRATD
jgi:hypothetical protein